MDKTTFTETRNKIERYVRLHRLHDAFAMVSSLAAGLSNTKILNEIQQAEESYRYMLDYATRGADDPSRLEMAQDLGRKILGFADRLERDYMRRDSSTLYFNTLRYEAMQRTDSIPSLIEQYRKLLGEGSMFNFVVSGAHSDKFQSLLMSRELLEKRVFNRVWTVHPLSAEQIEAVKGSLDDLSLPQEFRILLVWAITLGGLHYYDERRLNMLLDVYASSIRDANIENYGKLSAAAIIGALLLMHRRHSRGFSKQTQARIDMLLSESKIFSSDLRTCYLEFAKTIDTDRITRKIADEIVPEVLKLKPQIDKKIGANTKNFDPEEFEENPEWMEMLENSGIADKLKEMSEIQEEGGDVMMGTFSHLKTFPLFNEPYGWFLPFHAEFSEFSGADAAMMQPLAEIISKSPFLCDSDKYSFMLSLKQVPQSQRDIMMQQFNANADQMAEIQTASSGVRIDRANAINKTVQNAFRFFKLFRRKGEFFNPFASGINLIDIAPLREAITELQILPLVGEFYFSHGYYPQAIGAFTAMADDDNFMPDYQFYQKLGYAYQKIGDNQNALDSYSRAEMLNAKSDWTLTKLAHMLMLLNRPEDALKKYYELEKRYPNKISIALNIGRCQLELGNLDEALRAYFKAEYLGGKPEKTLRPLAWTLMISGDFERAGKYYDRIMLNLEPIPADYLNMGHLALAERRFREALNFYSLNVTSRNDGIDGLIADINADMPTLEKIGIDPTLMPLLIDSLLYRG